MHSIRYEMRVFRINLFHGKKKEATYCRPVVDVRVELYGTLQRLGTISICLYIIVG